MLSLVKSLLSLKSEAVFVVASRSGSALIQFGMILVYGMQLSPKQFGEVSIIFIIIAASYAVTDFGVANTVVSNKLNKESYGRLLSLNAFIACAVGLLLLFCSSALQSALTFSSEFRTGVNLFAIILPLYSLGIVRYCRLLKCGKLKRLALVDFLPTFVMALVITCLLALDLGIISVLYGQFAHVLLRVGLLFYLSPKLKFIFDITKIQIQGKLIKQLLNNFLMLLLGRIDQILIVSMISGGEYGRYAFLKQLLQQPITIISAIHYQYFFTKFCRLMSYSKKVVSYYYVSLIPALVSYFCYLGLIFSLYQLGDMFPDYASSSELIFALILASLVVFGRDTFVAVSLAARLISVQICGSIFALLVALSLAPLISRYGVETYIFTSALFGFIALIVINIIVSKAVQNKSMA